MSNKLGIVKLRDSGPFGALYYAGLVEVRSSSEIELRNPVRFVEQFVPKKISNNVVGLNGKQQEQTVMEPMVQDLQEISLGEVAVFPEASVQWVSTMGEDHLLYSAYFEAWTRGNEAKKKAIKTEKNHNEILAEN